jgi:hypothetical protein
LNDLLSDVCDGWLQPAELPTVLHGWRCTDRSIKPVTIRGIDWEQLAASNARSTHTIDISPLRSKEEMHAVLKYPHLVLQGDVSAIARLTGIWHSCCLQLLRMLVLPLVLHHRWTCDCPTIEPMALLGIITDEPHLKQMAVRITDHAPTSAALEAHGIQSLQSRIRTTDGGAAVSDVVHSCVHAQMPPASAPKQTGGLHLCA